jgi:hypothetical protein
LSTKRARLIFACIKVLGKGGEKSKGGSSRYMGSARKDWEQGSMFWEVDVEERKSGVALASSSSSMHHLRKEWKVPKHTCNMSFFRPEKEQGRREFTWHVVPLHFIQFHYYHAHNPPLPMFEVTTVRYPFTLLL